MKAEYDFSAMKNGVRGKYYERYRKGTNVVLLEPDVAKAFPTENAVNEALRGIISTARAAPEALPTGVSRTENASAEGRPEETKPLGAIHRKTRRGRGKD